MGSEPGEAMAKGYKGVTGMSYFSHARASQFRKSPIVLTAMSRWIVEIQGNGESLRAAVGVIALEFEGGSSLGECLGAEIRAHSQAMYARRYRLGSTALCRGRL